MTTSVWTVSLTDPAGTSPTALTGVLVDSLTFPLNEPAVAGLTVPGNHSGLAGFLADDAEVMIRRDGTILFWGPVVRVEIDQQQARVQCADPFWYLTRRYFGRADRINLLTNGDFEDGVTGWTASGLTPVVDPTRFVQGTSSVRLAGPSEGHNSYLAQTYTHTQSHPAGDLLTVAAWVYVPSADYEGTAFAGLGLYAEHRDAADALVNSEYETVDDATVKDEWVRLEVELPNIMTGHTVEVRLYPPFGPAWWDLATLTAMESLAFHEQDLATLLRGVVLYAQDRAPYGFGHGKSDVNLTPSAAPTGRQISRAWQFADHENIAQAINEYAGAKDGADWRISYTDTERTITFTHPHLGGDGTPVTTIDVSETSTFRWSWDREQHATSVVVLGPGDGPDREEGGAVNGSAAGPTVETVIVAPDRTLPGELDRLAAEELAVVSIPEILEVVVVGMVGVVQPGDWVTVDFTSFGISDTYRVVRADIAPENDAVTLTMNRREPQTVEEAMARFPRAVDACLAPGGGVWVVGSDGGVGAFGAAAFHGSLPADDIIPNAPVVAIVPHGAGGYWLVGADTGVFAYGDAPTRLPYTAMVDTEYPAGDRAIIAAEAYTTGGADSLIMIADDGATYVAATP